MDKYKFINKKNNIRIMQINNNYKGQMSGGVISLTLVFVVIAVFLTFAAVTLNGISGQTAGNSSDAAYNVTLDALTSAQTFSGFLNPMGLILVSVVFLFLIGKMMIK